MGGRKCNPKACREMLDYFSRWWLLTNNKDHSYVAKRLQDELGVQIRLMRKYFPKSAAIVTERDDAMAELSGVEIVGSGEVSVSEEVEYLSLADLHDSDSGEDDEEEEDDDDDDQLPPAFAATTLQHRPVRTLPVFPGVDTFASPPAPPALPQPRQVMPVPRKESRRTSVTQILELEDDTGREGGPADLGRTFRERKASSNMSDAEAVSVLKFWEEKGAKDSLVAIAREQVAALRSDGGGGDATRTEQRGLARAHDMFIFLENFFSLDSARSIQKLILAYRTGDLHLDPLLSPPSATSPDLPGSGPASAVTNEDVAHVLRRLRRIWTSFFAGRQVKAVELAPAFAPIAKILPSVRLAGTFSELQRHAASHPDLLDVVPAGPGRRNETRIMDIVVSAVGAESAVSRTRLTTSIAAGKRLLQVVDRLGHGALWLIDRTYTQSWLAKLPQPDFASIMDLLAGHDEIMKQCNAATVVLSVIQSKAQGIQGEDLPPLRLEKIDLAEDGVSIDSKLFDVET